MIRVVVAVVALGIISLPGSPSGAAVLRVGGSGGEYPTIQQAVAAAADDDTLLVAPGEYSAWVDWEDEDIWITKPLSIISEEGPQVTSIVGHPNTNSCIKVNTYSYTGAITVEGFTLDGQWEVDFGLSMCGGNPGVIRDCVVRHCRVAGLHILHLSYYEVTNCQFLENYIGARVTPDYIGGMSISDCVFIGNSYIAVDGDAAQVRRSYIHGGVLGVNCAEGAVVDGNLISSCGTGIALSGFTSGVATMNTIVNCGVGATTNYASSSYTFRGNIIVHNDIGMRNAYFGGDYDCCCVWGNGINYQGSQPGEDGFPDGDPMFCDALGGDYQLMEGSACGPEGPCGRIGCYGVGCSNSTVEPMTWGRVKALYR